MPGRALPGGVIALGLVSLCMDTSSELIHSLLPVFLVVGLGAGPVSLGVIEGVAEATASITKVFSGVISDWMGKRRPLVLLGYGLAAASKPLFPLASSVTTVFVARFADRIGKGIRGAPRDALVADITPQPLLGAAYGLRQSLDTVGAFLGPVLAMALMLATDEDIRLVLWVAVVPALLAVGIIVVFVKEPPSGTGRVAADKRTVALHWRELSRLPRAYWRGVAFAAVLTLARFSEAFLLLRASELGLAAALVPLVMIAMNLAYALSAYPVGMVSDRLGRGPLLMLGIALLIVADGFLAAADHVAFAVVGAVFWGLHMGATQGVLSAMVADSAPGALRGSAFGLFNFASGLALLLASVVAGVLWSEIGAAATFFASAAFAGLAFILLLCWRPGEAAVKSAPR